MLKFFKILLSVIELILHKTICIELARVIVKTTVTTITENQYSLPLSKKKYNIN